MYWVTGILGLFMMIAPFFFNYGNNMPAIGAGLVTGAIVAIASYKEAMKKDTENWEYWTAEVLGIFAILSPFLFGFTNHQGATWTSVVMGMLLALLAGSRLSLGDL